jgi:hypothetical protein
MEEATGRTIIHAARPAAVKPVTAFQAFPSPNGHWGIGLCVRLAPGARIEICGPGFSARTVLAQSEGAFYFVLLDSVTKQETTAR